MMLYFFLFVIIFFIFIIIDFFLESEINLDSLFRYDTIYFISLLFSMILFLFKFFYFMNRYK